MKKENFNQRCYKLLKKVPRGKVTTYAEIARALRSRAFRAVGQAMGRNPDAPRVPCHRVICSDGRLGGYSGGIKKKIKLLHKEGVLVENGRIKELKKHLYHFGSTAN